MALNKDKNLKLYFSISEVAQMFDVNESTLRFWEKEFDIIRPRKTPKGTRFYKQEDIDAVRLIFHLVKERGMTLAGARQKLKDNRETTIRQEENEGTDEGAVGGSTKKGTDAGKCRRCV